MPVLLHITAAEHEKSIVRAGIKPGKHMGGVFFMPHMKEFLISHQWGRELKRSGIRNFIAVDFRLPKLEKVWFGKYSEGHKLLPLTEAIQKFACIDKKYGYEFVVERKVEAKEIIRTRTIAKPIGWRYEPQAHGKKPCPCPMCIQSGGYKTNRLKEKYESRLTRERAREVIEESNDDNEILEALRRMQGKRRKESPEYLNRHLESRDEFVLYALVELLDEHSHPLANEYMEVLSKGEDEDSSELAQECLRHRSNKVSTFRDTAE